MKVSCECYQAAYRVQKADRTKGIREDTSKMITSMGVQDLWVELELEKAREFAEKKLRILEK